MSVMPLAAGIPEKESRKMLSLSEGNTMKFKEGQGRGVTLEVHV